MSSVPQNEIRLLRNTTSNLKLPCASNAERDWCESVLKQLSEDYGSKGFPETLSFLVQHLSGVPISDDLNKLIDSSMRSSLSLGSFRVVPQPVDLRSSSSNKKRGFVLRGHKASDSHSKDR